LKFKLEFTLCYNSTGIITDKNELHLFLIGLAELPISVWEINGTQLGKHEWVETAHSKLHLSFDQVHFEFFNSFLSPLMSITNYKELLAILGKESVRHIE
jgi:hypothetical protein